MDQSIVDVENINYLHSDIESETESINNEVQNNEEVKPASSPWPSKPPSFNIFGENKTERVSVNTYEIKDLKTNIPSYEEKNTTIDSWLDSALYIAE